MLPISQRAWALMLAAVCAWWVMLAFGRTSRMALALPGDARPAIAARAAFDLSDAARHGRGNPRVLALTAGFAAFGALGLLARRR